MAILNAPNQTQVTSDFDIHELTLHVLALETGRRIDEQKITKLKAEIEALLAGGFVGNLRIDGTLTVRDDIILVSH